MPLNEEQLREHVKCSQKLKDLYKRNTFHPLGCIGRGFYECTRAFWGRTTLCGSSCWGRVLEGTKMKGSGGGGITAAVVYKGSEMSGLAVSDRMWARLKRVWC